MREDTKCTFLKVTLIVILLDPCQSYYFPKTASDYISQLYGYKYGMESGKAKTDRSKNKIISEESPSRSDPWKVLIRKLETTKDAKETFGKVNLTANAIPILDELKCPHFGVCSGCTRTGEFKETPIVLKAKSFFNAEGIKFNAHIGETSGWRTHAKLAVQPLSRWGGLKIGLYKAASHDVVPIPDCRVHHPRINEAVEELRTAATDAGVKG